MARTHPLYISIYQPAAHGGAYRDGLGDITGRHPEISIGDQPDVHPYLEVTNRCGVDVALDILRSRPPRTVTYIALGPLTNLALMMRADSKLVTERIGRIVCMGGALDVPGNCSPMAECIPHFLPLPFLKPHRDI
jgi:inosine-uridine nucleoside N-ribohydrolase